MNLLIYSGDKDFICNWRGGEKWSNNVDWAHKDEFAKKEMTEWKDGGKTYGTYKTIENFTFLRVFEAGHMVPMD